MEEARDVAESLATQVHALLCGDDVAAMADDLVAHGADKVSIVEHEALSQFTADGWLAALAPILEAARPVITLTPDSDYQRAWLPRLSARWRIPMATGGIRVKITDDGYPEVSRVSHNGKLHERQIWARGTAVMVMLRPASAVSVPGAAAGRPTSTSSDRTSIRRRSATGRCGPCRPIRRTWT